MSWPARGRVGPVGPTDSAIGVAARSAPSGMSFRRDVSSITSSAVRSTPSGGLAVPATLTRVGVFEYPTAKGVRRELRLPEDVFDPVSMASFAGAPVTIGHPGKVTPGSWKKDAVGHVGESVTREDALMKATLYINDAGALANVSGGKLLELSNGYDADLDWTPGVHPEYGKYDCIQRNIRGNHVALCPPGTARAGGSARLHLDEEDAVGEFVPAPDQTKADVGEPTTSPGLGPIINTPGGADNKNSPSAIISSFISSLDTTEAALRADGDISVVSSMETVPKGDHDKVVAELEATKAKYDAVQAKFDLQSHQLDKLKTDSADTARFDAAIEARIALVDAARPVVGAAYSFAGKTDRQVRVDTITAIDPTFKADGKADAYVDAAFDFALKGVSATKAQKDAVTKTVTAALHGDNTETPELSPAEKFAAKQADAWKPKKES